MDGTHPRGGRRRGGKDADIDQKRRPRPLIINNRTAGELKDDRLFNTCPGAQVGLELVGVFKRHPRRQHPDADTSPAFMHHLKLHDKTSHTQKERAAALPA